MQACCMDMGAAMEIDATACMQDLCRLVLPVSSINARLVHAVAFTSIEVFMPMQHACTRLPLTILRQAKTPGAPLGAGVTWRLDKVLSSTHPCESSLSAECGDRLEGRLKPEAWLGVVGTCRHPQSRRHLPSVVWTLNKSCAQETERPECLEANQMKDAECHTTARNANLVIDACGVMQA